MELTQDYVHWWALVFFVKNSMRVCHILISKPNGLKVLCVHGDLWYGYIPTTCGTQNLI
jgi:hypothetical protein